MCARQIEGFSIDRVSQNHIINTNFIFFFQLNTSDRILKIVTARACIFICARSYSYVIRKNIYNIYILYFLLKKNMITYTKYTGISQPIVFETSPPTYPIMNNYYEFHHRLMEFSTIILAA